jgi:serine/threonine protein kinase
MEDSMEITDTYSIPKQKSPADITTVPCTPKRDDNKLEIYQPSILPTPALNYSRFYSDFKILNLIGNGSFGSVYCAESKLDGIKYAIKRSVRKFQGFQDRLRMMHEVKYSKMIVYMGLNMSMSSQVHALAALSAKEDADVISTIVRYYCAWQEVRFSNHIL